MGKLKTSSAGSSSVTTAHSLHDPNVLLHFVSGGVAAAISKTIVAPIERVKLLLQVQHASKHIESGQRYKGVIDCFVRISREQGVVSYWRGNTINVIRAFPNNAINFASKDKYQRIFSERMTSSNSFISKLMVNVLSGSAAGATSLTILHPLDFARTRLAADIGRSKNERQFNGIINCLTKTFKNDGLRGLYRGYLVSIPEIMIFRGFYFGLYDTFRPDNASLLLNYLFAQSVTTISIFFAYPLDTVRRRMMMQSCLPVDERMYKSTTDCWMKIARTNGISGFYHGVTANVMRGLGGAIVLVMYDYCKKMF